MKIETATLDDIPELRILVESCYRGDSSRKGWTHEADLIDGTRISHETLKEDLLKPGVVMLKGVDNSGRIIGCVYTEVQNDKMYVGMLCINPDLQAQGLGKTLMSAVDELAKEKGCSAAKMQVISRRTELIEYYKRRGYRNTGETQPWLNNEEHGRPKVPLEFVVLQKDY